MKVTFDAGCLATWTFVAGCPRTHSVATIVSSSSKWRYTRHISLHRYCARVASVYDTV